MSDRPFRILGLQQIAIGGLDKAKLAKLWVDTLGVPLAGNYSSERENVDEDILRAGHAVPSRRGRPDAAGRPGEEAGGARARR